MPGAAPYDRPMTWFFAILVVVVMGGVAVVATGAGGSMAETFDDRPDARVPADRPLGAADLRRVRFGTAFRGYRMSEVDALLDRLAVELEPPVRDRPTDLPRDRPDDLRTDPPATDRSAADRSAADRSAADRPVPERSDRDA